MVADTAADLEVDKVADKVADLGVDKVADMVVDKKQGQKLVLSDALAVQSQGL